jgi:hypothetical protein
MTHHQTASWLFQKADLLPKQLTGTKKAKSFWKCRCQLFGAKSYQMSQLWNSISFIYVVMKKSHFQQYKLIVYYYMMHWKHHLGRDPMSIKSTSNSRVFVFSCITSLQGPIKTEEQAW